MAHRYPIAGIAAACSAVLVAVAVAAALVVAADSAAWPVVVAPIRRSVLSLDSWRLPVAGFPSQGCDMFVRYARAIPA